MDIESTFSSTQSAPHCPCRRQHGLILHWILSCLSLGLREYKFCSNQFSPFRFLDYSRRLSRMHLQWLLVVLTSTLEAVRQLFSDAFSTPVAFLVWPRVPALLSRILVLLLTSSLRMGCYCCCTCQLLLRVTLGAGLGVASLSNNTRSPFFRNHSVNAIPGHSVMGDDRRGHRFPELQSLILRYGWGIVWSSRGFSSSGLLPNGSRGVKKTVCLDSSENESTPKNKKIPCERHTLSSQKE